MTRIDPIKALVGLEAQLQEQYNKNYNVRPLADTLHTILAAIEALKPLADGTLKGGCKMAWKQGFCYGDPEYYPPPA